MKMLLLPMLILQNDNVQISTKMIIYFDIKNDIVQNNTEMSAYFHIKNNIVQINTEIYSQKYA